MAGPSSLSDLLLLSKVYINRKLMWGDGQGPEPRHFIVIANGFPMQMSDFPTTILKHPLCLVNPLMKRDPWSSVETHSRCGRSGGRGRGWTHLARPKVDNAHPFLYELNQWSSQYHQDKSVAQVLLDLGNWGQ